MRRIASFGYVVTLFIGVLAVGAVLVAALGGSSGCGAPYCLDYPTESGSINYYRPSSSGGAHPGQDNWRGWRNFGGETFDIYTPEYCKEITISSGAHDMFIPTRTAEEWNSFKNASHPRVTVSTCSTGTGCDINSGPVCGETCDPGNYCFGYFPSTYLNECDAIDHRAYGVRQGACPGGGSGEEM